MNALGLVVVLLTICYGVGKGIYPVPQISDVTFCFSPVCIEETISMISQANQIVVAMPVRNIADEGYLSIYLGWVMDMLSLLPRKASFLIYEPTNGSIVDAALELLRRLPMGSIFMSLEHGSSSFGIRNLQVARKTENIEKGIAVVHLNHEQPWRRSKPRDADLAETFLLPEETASAYSKFPLIFRNYYYRSFENISVFLPAGVPLYGYRIGNISSSFYETKLKPASSRKHFCLFTGRFEYSDDITHDQNEERKELWDLAVSGQLTKCVVATGDSSENDFHTHSYEDYVELMSEVVFSPCPAGNNPETFRIYESLELGAIPIIIRPSNPELDYVGQSLWATFPGPILKSWKELQPFLSSIDSSQLDSLQREVQAWYGHFRFQVKTKNRQAYQDFHDAMVLEAEATSRTQECRMAPLCDCEKLRSEVTELRKRDAENVEMIRLLLRELQDESKKKT